MSSANNFAEGNVPALKRTLAGSAAGSRTEARMDRCSFGPSASFMTVIREEKRMKKVRAWAMKNCVTGLIDANEIGSSIKRLKREEAVLAFCVRCKRVPVEIRELSSKRPSRGKK